jgi:hypothetical protein
VTAVRARYVNHHPLLGRHVNHDPQSRRYAFRARRVLVDTAHTRRIAVLDQGQLGSCTGNAALGCIGTDPFYTTEPATMDWSEGQAVEVYSEATSIDPWPGAWPPDDTGSDGLSVAKVLQDHGWVSGYQHAFSLPDALSALVDRPVITGTNWYESMFDPSPTGEVRVTAGSQLAGGHEYVADRLDVTNGRVWFTNSWGTGWGAAGRFWMSFDTWQRLLSEDGDVTVFTPNTQPPPVPTPTPDETFAEVAKPWAAKRHCGPNAVMARATKTWLAAKGL